MEKYRVQLAGGDHLDLPIVAIDDKLSIALLMYNDEAHWRQERIIRAMLRQAPRYKPEAIVGIAEQGIILAREVSRCLGLPRTYILRKEPKVFGEWISTEYESATKGAQTLCMPTEWAHELDGRRIVIIEDVTNTGGTLKAALRLLSEAEGQFGVQLEVEKILVVLTEGYEWWATLDFQSGLVKGLGHIPMFHTETLEPIEETL